MGHMIKSLALFFLLAGCVPSPAPVKKSDTPEATPAAESRPPATDVVLAEARKFEDAKRGKGKIEIQARVAALKEIIPAYEKARAAGSREAAKRLEELWFEKDLLLCLKQVFDVMKSSPGKRKVGLLLDCKWIQIQVRGAFKDAEIFEMEPKVLEEHFPDFQRWFDPSLPPLPEKARKPNDPAKDYSAWFSQVLNVPPPKLPKWLKENVIEAKDLHGYQLTHKLFTLALMKYAWPEESLPPGLDAKIKGTASKVGEEARADDVFSDLNTERAAMLLALGFGDLVERAWIKRIMNNQHRDGYWGRTADSTPPSLHTTYLAIWALTGYESFIARGEKGRAVLFPFPSSAPKSR